MTTTPLMDTSELDQTWLDEMNDAMKGGGGVQLPFDFVTAWPHNGDRNMVQFAAEFPVPYFGGFHMDDVKLIEMDEAGKLGVPLASMSTWKYTQMHGDEGAYNVYAARVLTMSIVAYRMSWVSKEGKLRSPIYTDLHPRSHVQYLALIGAKNAEGKIVPLCPAVISAKGKGQTEALKTAVATWKKAVDQHRKALNAQNLPLAAFWLTIGTAGEQPVFEKVGNGQQSHEITPMKAIMPATVTAEIVAGRFVGKDTLKYTHELLTQAREWLAAWQSGNIQTRNDYTPAPQPGAPGAPVVTRQVTPKPQPQGNPNEIPF